MRSYKPTALQVPEFGEPVVEAASREGLCSACFGQSVWRVERYLWLSSQSKLGVLLRAKGLMYFARVALERCPVCSMMT